MAIRVRRGLKQDFDPNKLLESELATTLDTRELYAAFAPGNVQKIATYENVQSMVTDAAEEVVETLTVEVNAATESAQTATQGANTAATHATTEGNYAKTQGDYAKAQGDAAKSIVNDNIATPTIPGNVRGGGDIVVDQTTGDMTAPTKLDKTGDTKDTTITFADATADANITSGSKLSIIIGLIKYKLSSILTSLAGKIDKTSIVITDTVNDTTKVLGANVGYTLGQEIDALNLSKLSVIGVATPTDPNTAPVGIFYFNGTVNAPSFFTGDKSGYCLSVQYSADYIVQFAMSFNNDAIAFRRKLGGAWSSWVKELSALDLVNTDATNDTTKPLAANVGYALGLELDDLRNGIVNIAGEHKFTKGILVTGTSYNDAPVQLKANYNLNPNMRAGISFENIGINAASLYFDIDGKLKYIDNSGNIHIITTT